MPPPGRIMPPGGICGRYCCCIAGIPPLLLFGPPAAVLAGVVGGWGPAVVPGGAAVEVGMLFAVDEVVVLLDTFG